MSAKAFLLLSTTLFFSMAHAAVFELPVQEGDRILVKGLNAQVQFVAQGGNQLRINGPQESSQAGQYVVQRRDRVIEIQMNDFSSKKDWKEALGRSAQYARKIEISGPALPVEVHLRDGSVSLLRWTKEAHINLVNGRVSSQNGSSSLQARVSKGDVTVVEHNGKVSVDTYSGNITLRQITGDIDAQSFSGQLVVEKAKGFASINTQQANAKINQSSGSLQFENGKGPLTIQGYQGRIEGQNQEGVVSIGFLPDSEVHVKSKAGRINIQAPAGSGASVNLAAVEGDIFVPKELRVNRAGSEKSVRGRLRGESVKASVNVRSQEGSISVK